MMQIVINADDFGMSRDTVAATIACFESGAISSATIMVNMPETAAAVDFARAHPEFSFGVHLTYCGDGDGVERPACEPGEVSALVDADGRFLSTTAIRLKALLGRLPSVQIERETEAQLARLRDWGVPVSHVDSHSHLHKIGPFRQALQRVLPRFGIRRVRNVQNIYIRRQYFNVTYWMGGRWRRRVMEAFDTTEYFYMPSSGLDDGWCDPVLAAIPGEGTLEVGVHPGSGESWRQTEDRDVREFAQRARAGGHAIVPWHEAVRG
jgi:predicted glycoside hydrolase/deacetylase ChbG (UPF0249 family)